MLVKNKIPAISRIYQRVFHEICLQNTEKDKVNIVISSPLKFEAYIL